MSKAKLRKSSFNWHQKLAWLSLLALLLFIGSALTHPLLSWTGPKAAKFRPPSMQAQAQELNAIPSILAHYQIESAQIVKVVPSAKGNVLQVTTNSNSPRRYFALNTGLELPNFDQEHAVWLAKYYIGNNDLTIKRVHFQTEFDSAYPWVNRLLPVYKVEFSDPANTSTYIHTELNALAGVGNDYKTQMQAIFRNLHTWSWLNGVEYARIIIMALLLGCAFLMTVAGIGLLWLLRSRPNMSRRTKVHRVLAYIVAIPMLGFCISGFYHLLHYGLIDTQRGMIPSDAISLSAMNQQHSLTGFATADLPTSTLNHISLMEYQGELLYRLSLAPKKAGTMPSMQTSSNDEHAHHNRSIKARDAHFKGNPSEQGGLYFSTQSGEQATVTDRQVAIQLANEHLGITTDKISHTQLIKRFGMHYDFRNKRLPVWQVDFATELGDKLFVDPATGTIVDRLVNKDRYEGYSFSFLHKWNFLTPFIGRFWRDVLIVLVLFLTLIVSFIGLSMKLRR